MTLIPLADVKTWLGIDVGDTSNDAKLVPLHESVEGLIIDYCECNFASNVVENEVHDGLADDVIVPEGFPVISVERVALYTESDGTGGTTLLSSQYDVREWEIVLREGLSTPRGRGLVAIDYTHGYASVPAVVQQAIKLGVEAFLNRDGRSSLGISSRSKEGESESYTSAWDPKSGLPKEVTAMLYKYKSMEITSTSALRSN